MDRISQLPDEFLIKVLFFLPTKVAVSTSILSKRWEFLWMWLPKLEYDCSGYSESKRKMLRNFINLYLPLHRAPDIECLRLKFSKGYSGSIKPKDVRLWVAIAVTRCIRELSVTYSLSQTSWHTKLPSSLYTCKSLVILKLIEEIFVDVPRMTCLPSLKTLVLRCVNYADANSLHKLLSRCPVLEHLDVERGGFDHFETLSITVPSLQRLTVKTNRGNGLNKLEINTPSLKYLKVTDYWYEADSDNYDLDDLDLYSFESKDMPELEEAEIESTFPDIDKFVESITYVKRFSSCIRVYEFIYRTGHVFNQLQHLKLCSCYVSWSKLLVRFLQDSPNLREVEIYVHDDHKYLCVYIPWFRWENNLDCVPECLLSSLETFKWTWIYGSQQHINLLKYLLGNACCLKTVTILFSSSYDPEGEDKFERMKQDLSLSFRRSEPCQLVFV